MKSLLGLRRNSTQTPTQSRLADNATSSTAAGGAPQIPSIPLLSSPLLGFPIGTSSSNHTTSRPGVTAQRRYTSVDPRSTSASDSEVGSGLPAYRPPPTGTSPISIPDRRNIPTYDEALSFSPASPRPGSSIPPRHRASSVMSIGTEGNRLVRDTFGTSTSDVRDTVWVENEGDDDEGTGEGDEDDDDDPFAVRRTRPPPRLNLLPLPTRRFTAPTTSRPPTPPSSNSTTSLNLPPDRPPPPEGPPGYSAHLASDECRILSTVHMEHNHPAAAFFSAMTASALTANPIMGSSSSQTRSHTTGGKKLKLTIPRGAERYRTDGTGPLYCRMGRGGRIEGTIEVGKVDHVTDLDVAILGLVNTSYYIRGQYTLIDTLPLARRRVILYPVNTATEGFAEPSTNNNSTNVPTPPTPAQATGGVNRQNTSSSDLSTPPIPETIVVGKDTFLAPDQSFSFSIQMPDHHYRDETVELPPSAQIVQVGMQASVEYVLRVKLTRKGWRMNDTIGVPIIYEPRAYIPPRRLRLLSYDDALNPGWRTIRLNGGKPHSNDVEPRSNAPGVEVLLLLPSPPILFIPYSEDPPPIPFHLHFHSSSTLPLSTFSDPKESRFIIRLMRVASMRIGSEKDIRRMEIPSKVEIWQEGGERLVLGEDPGGVMGSESNGVGGGSGSNRPSSSNGERRRSFSDRRPSFLRRKQSVSTSTPPAAGTSPTTETDSTTPLARQVSNLPGEPTISEEGGPSQVTSPIRAPLTLDATDVHLFGQLTIVMPREAPLLFRTLVQSFMCPEVGISYVLEVGLQPKKGAVKEAFSHVWGGGLIEIVLGNRPTA